MTRYNKIFWLEDHPDDLVGIDQAENVSLQEVMHSVTMAHDYETAREIVGQEKFDLYVIDSDFPYQIDFDHLDKVQECMQAIRDGRLGDVKEIEEHTMVSNNRFVDFYNGCLDDVEGDVVVFSRSKVVPHIAFQLNLPYYSKQSFSEEVIRNQVRTVSPKLLRILSLKEGVSRPLTEADQWECGNVLDFVRNYLK